MINLSPDSLPHVHPFTIPIEGVPITLADLQKAADKAKLYGNGFEARRQQQLATVKAAEKTKK
jgi:hypothetical protein